MPGTNVRYGIDGLIGLVPVFGDIITTAIALWVVREARALGAPRYLVARMLANVAIDGAVGAVPLVGDAFDVAFKANVRNIRMLRKWMDKQKWCLPVDCERSEAIQRAPTGALQRNVEPADNTALFNLRATRAAGLLRFARNDETKWPGRARPFENLSESQDWLTQPPSCARAGSPGCCTARGCRPGRSASR